MKKQLRFVPLINEFDKFIRCSASGRRRKPDGDRISVGTIDSYKNCRKLINKFAMKFGAPLLYTGLSVNKGIVRERIRYWKQIIHTLTDYLRQCQYSDNYIWNNLKILRTLMHYIKQQGLPDPGFADVNLPRIVHTDPLTLSLEQLRQLIHIDFNSTYCGERLRLARDIMVTGCITALRYSDLMALRWDQLVWREDKSWINIQSIKTGIVSRILLPEYLMSMMLRHKRYGRKWIFPRISNVNLNLQLKDLGRNLGWNESILQMKSRKGVLIPNRNQKLYELLTTHTCRRTGITLMLQLGMPEHVVRQISGHTPNGKEFYRYVKIAQSWQDSEAERVHKIIYQSE